jgi:hypothetical protein
MPLREPIVGQGRGGRGAVGAGADADGPPGTPSGPPRGIIIIIIIDRDHLPLPRGGGRRTVGDRGRRRLHLETGREIMNFQCTPDRLERARAVWMHEPRREQKASPILLPPSPSSPSINGITLFNHQKPTKTLHPPTRSTSGAGVGGGRGRSTSVGRSCPGA